MLDPLNVIVPGSCRSGVNRLGLGSLQADAWVGSIFGTAQVDTLAKGHRLIAAT